MWTSVVFSLWKPVSQGQNSQPEGKGRNEDRLWRKGRQGGLEETDWETRLRSDLNQSVSHPANQATRLLSLRIKRTCELPFIFYIQSVIESAWLGVASGLRYAAWRRIWLMLFECLLQHESREKRRQGCLHSVLCFRCNENRVNPPRKVFWVFGFYSCFLFPFWMRQSECVISLQFSVFINVTVAC